MDPILVDTNIISFTLKDDTRRFDYEPHLVGKRACVAFMTVAELYRWAIERKWGARRIGRLVHELTQCVVLPYDDELAWHWARVRSIKGMPVDPSDAWIAATALRHNLPLVTHNRRHFEAIPGLTVISEA